MTFLTEIFVVHIFEYFKTFIVTYFAVSAPLVINVLISNSWPYRAAMCKGVFPFLSSQSISAPKKTIVK